MSSNALKAIATGKPEQPKDLAHLLALPSVQAQIKAALPRHLTAERMARIATTEMRRVPKLAQCEPMSFLGAVIQCAQLGLEPGGALGHVYILPFDKREKVGGQWKTVRTEAQVILGYRGMIDLARRSGQIVSIDARAVYEGDKFECKLGLHPVIEHEPDWQNANRADPTKLRFVYAVARLRDGGIQFDVMSRSEVEAIRKRSKASTEGPWITDYSAMALKTVVRRLFKFLPVSIEIQRAVGLDELADAGISQGNATILEGGEYVAPSLEANGEEPEPEQQATATDNAQVGDAADVTAEPDDRRYATFADQVTQAEGSDVASLVLDEARSVLSAQAYDSLVEVWRGKWARK